MPTNFKTYNFNIAEIDKHPFIFIIGLTGSGKTTLAKKLSKQTNRKIYSTDQVRFKYGAIRDKNNQLYSQLQVQAVKELLDGDEPHLIEGTGLLYLEYSWLAKQPLIILQTSVITASLRRSIRANKNFIKIFKKAYKQNKDFHAKRIEELKQHISEVK